MLFSPIVEMHEKRDDDDDVMRVISEAIKHHGQRRNIFLSGTPLLSWRELTKQEWDNWHEGRVKELKRLHKATFKQTMNRGGSPVVVQISVVLRFLCGFDDIVCSNGLDFPFTHRA